MPNIYSSQYDTSVNAPMVIETQDRNSISPTEAVAKAREDAKREASKNRIPGQEVYEDQEAARGMMLHHSEFIRRLQRLNPKILIVPGGVEGAVAVRYPLYEDGEWQNAYITGFYLQPMPEFSSVTLDDKGLPHREIRGWRSVLLALLRKGALTRQQVDVTFGPASGQRSGIWYRTLQAQEQLRRTNGT